MQLVAGLAAPAKLSDEASSTSDEALRLAISLAVDAGEYDRAAVLLDVLKSALPAGRVTSLSARRARRTT